MDTLTDRTSTTDGCRLPRADVVRVGSRFVPREAARDHAVRYLTEPGWAYPAYDGYRSGSASGPLEDADLLAPVLLNVPHLGIRTYEELRRALPVFQGILDRIPVELDLLDAGPAELDLLGELFSVLDGAGIHGAGGTVLSKVLHRKRPRFIPLYDERVRRVYQDGDGAPVPAVRGRTWQAFFPLFAAAVRSDLQRDLPFWAELAGLATEPVVTPLRALDIVAWRAGGTPAPAPRS